ncbi:hypothetical protein FB45DRAFT_1052164 [Roridomyces roridus]|uniref:Alpha/beta hydrolase fold-3 domain-containing protein n=1 Tax=Roridomyces roridus TaxID=1738132 RepID=A0AAD7G0W4_9AGAR|nr:hypothetical protein FB45DRAFT_1052164 [Roridomyces roridus]
MSGNLTAQAGLRIGPLVLETLVKHYFDRLKASKEPVTQLKRDELLYDEAFTIIKTFLSEASYHTVEEVQAFSNTRTPSPPWVHVVRLVVPMSCCDEASTYLITALGGEDAARSIIGGCKWWQVRGVNGVEAQWITAKKDWEEAKRRYKSRSETKPASDVPLEPDSESAPYEEHMDEMRCILYAHGGGYYFGSVDQERYSIQRHARKINGRVFAVQYRLSPQYPFPCALQDLLASYLYLIKPPPEASHRPVNPAHIVVSGDSAGGGLTLALLQILRDTGLPLPAGGVLISPWCDLTHSFPSIYTNTDTDVIPSYGLSFQKPSSLWPPPSEDMSRKVHTSLRSWVRSTFSQGDSHTPTPPSPNTATTSVTDVLGAPATAVGAATDVASDAPADVASDTVEDAPTDVTADVAPPPAKPAAFDLGATASVPQDGETVTLTTESGEVLRIDKQVHLYAQNSLIVHPLISGAMSYLGGLPPLLIIASDKEVLRDEIIYTAHKAANPDKYPILRDDIRKLYPPLEGIESRYGPTKVHLQVYDDTAHVLPVLFAFTTPGKYCYRAVASFCRHVTGMRHPQRQPTVPTAQQDKSDPGQASTSDGPDEPASGKPVRRVKSAISFRRLSVFRSSTLPPVPSPRIQNGPMVESPSPIEDAGSYVSTNPSTNAAPNKSGSTSSDVAGPRFAAETSAPQPPESERTAGEPVVYSDWKDGIMIRERVSTRGVVRALEAEEELSAFSVAPENVGVVSEAAVRRFLDTSQRFDRKFASAAKKVEKHRSRNLERAKKDTVRNMSVLQNYLGREAENKKTSRGETAKGIKEGLMASSGTWGWALDSGENPPPSSIVSRRDTQEALRLARIADQPMLQSEHSVTGNNLWSVVINFLTVNPDKGKFKKAEEAEGLPVRKSTLSKIFPPKRKDIEKDEVV